ncbi:MAG: 2-amino-4-hydroxy-6-hydroxymethyldihydropteridine diphosphokinase [Planctomycetota bacterium]
MTDLLVGFGSNLGDRSANLRYALSVLEWKPGIHLRGVSSFLATDPVGGPPQPCFLNAAAHLETNLPPHGLLHRLQQLEWRRGRRRGVVNGPRTLDLDLLLFGCAVLADEELTLPHPRLEERAFVLEPLAEIASTLRLPSGRTPGESLRVLQS